MSRLAAVLILALSLCSTAHAGIIFQDNFDNSPDWESQESLEGTSPGNILWATYPSLAMQAPQNWSDYRSTRGALGPLGLGQKNLRVSAQNGRGGSGKALTAYYEIVNGWAGGHLGKYLGADGYTELYVRWYRKFQPGWQYRTKSSPAAIHKLIRIMSNIDDPRDYASANPQDMYAVPNGRPDWKHNCDVANGGTGGSGALDPETGTKVCGKQAYLILQDHSSVGTMLWDQLNVNYEGHTGSTNDPVIFFDSRAFARWRDYHGEWTPGTFPGSADTTGDYLGNGEWVQYEVHVKMNDVGSTNFLFELFLNGTKVAQMTNVEFRKSTLTRFNYIMLPDNMLNTIYYNVGMPSTVEQAEQWFAIDDVVIYTPVTNTDPLWATSPQDGRLPLNYTISGSAPADTTPPTVLGFTIPATYSSTTVPVNTFAASDDVGVTGYLITTSAIPPGAGWSMTPQTTVTAVEGSNTFYAWARDAAGNVSAAATATVTVTLTPSPTSSTPRLRGNLRGAVR